MNMESTTPRRPFQFKPLLALLIAAATVGCDSRLHQDMEPSSPPGQEHPTSASSAPASRPQVNVVTLPSSVGANTYLAHLTGQDDCLIIDSGTQPSKVIERLKSLNLRPAALLVTHGHFDHIAGNAEIKARWPDCRIVVGVEDAARLTDPQANFSAGGPAPVVGPAADVQVKDGDVFEEAGLRIEARAVPGHSPGHRVYILRQREPAMVFVGDAIFEGSIGRTDFADGDPKALIANIRSKILTLPDSTMLFPGHGPSTSVGREKKTNPFVGKGVSRE